MIEVSAGESPGPTMVAAFVSGGGGGTTKAGFSEDSSARIATLGAGSGLPAF